MRIMWGGDDLVRNADKIFKARDVAPQHLTWHSPSMHFVAK